MNTHNITSARYSTESTAIAAPVIAMRNGREESRRANDDIDGGGMLAYLAEGGKIDKFIAPPLTEADYATAIQEMIDNIAREHGYQNGFTMAGYVTCPIYGTEAQAFVDWRGRVWKHAYSELEKIKNGEVKEPLSIKDFIETLEKLEIARGH